MKKFFVFLAVVLIGLLSKAQDINHNYFSFDNKRDTVAVSSGFRFGSIALVQPITPHGLSSFQKKAYEEFPERVGVGNFILDIRTRFLRDTLSGVGHDGLLGMNLSLLRSRVFVGYQYNRKNWYANTRFGYEVYRMSGGEIRANKKRFSQNVPLVGVELGYLPEFWNQTLRVRILGEYDFNNLGWYGSGTLTAKIYGDSRKRLELGTQIDGIFGYGIFTSFLWDGNLLYLSSFEGQLPFQETRFPEQRIGMSRGFALGFQKNFR